MIASTQSRPEFLQRISVVHKRSRRVRLSTLVAGAVCAWLIAVALLTVSDYLFELTWGVRAGIFGLMSTVVVAGTLIAWYRECQRRSETRTASELEGAFPNLGQRARTTVQYGGQTAAEMHRAGVRPELVNALVLETSSQSAELPLDDIVPRQRFWTITGLLIATATALALGCVNWEWRRAMARTFLSDQPYTELAVIPGDVTVQTGAAVAISAQLTGRTDRNVVIRFRKNDSDDSDSWTTQSLLADTATQRAVTAASFGVGLEGIEHPLVYRIEADSLVSPEYRIDVLDPLTIHRVTADVEYPAYTRLPARTFSDGAISALRGSTCRITVELSRTPQDVELLLQELPTKSNPQEAFEEVSVAGPLVTFLMPIERNLLWTLSAITADGVSLKEQPFRIRVTEDRPPKLAFDDPDDGIEVHTLAELPMRARASDDYGLTRSGVIFQISGSEEFTLLEEHFDEVLEVVNGKNEVDLTAPQTRSVLERLLPLEHFSLTQKDSVMYYAFAEDNHPLESQRTESDRRFIDIRPLLQTFRRRDDDGGGGGGGGDRSRLTSLSELIRRERSILNWTIKLSQRGESDQARDVLSFDRLMRSQAEIADLTRLLAEQLLERGVDDVDALYQAEAVMLEAIDSLSVGDLETAQLQEKDAQQYLVEGRDRLEIILSNRPTESIDYQSLRNLNKMILQKLRRNRNNNDNDRQEAAQLIVTQLMRLARSEEEVAEQLAAISKPSRNGTQAQGAENSETPGETPTSPAETDDATTDNESNPENSSRNSAEDDTPSDGADRSSESPSDVMEEPESDSLDMATIEERQYEILADARELAGILDELDTATELAKERMTDVTAQLEETAKAIESRETPTARAGAFQSASELREIARQIVGLTQGDALERIAFSRNLTADLMQRQRQLAEELEAEQMPEADPQESDPAGMTARDLAARALTLEDVLQAIAKSTEQEDGEAADRVGEAIEQRELAGIRQRLADLADELDQDASGMGSESSPESMEEKPGLAKAAAELRDTADSEERLAADLDQIYRQLLTPVIERLRDLEQQAAELAEQLEEPDNERQGGGLVEELEELIEEMERADAGGSAREQLDELLQGRGAGELWESAEGASRLRLRGEYRQALSQLLEELQLELQELVLADTDLDADSPIPAKYAPLVERYLKVLSQGN